MDLTACDVIGDVHGEAGKLEALLRLMGYERRGGTWRHPDRRAVFVGDLVDRGPGQVETCRIVRDMIEADAGTAVMGNHEFNAIAYATPDGRGDWCRPNGGHNRDSHRAFLDAVGEGSDLHRELVDWFLTLPLWLDAPGIRVVHACWDRRLIEEAATMLAPGARLTREMMPDASGATSTGRPMLERDGGRAPDVHPLYRAVETLLKGVEIRLPEGSSFTAEGKVRDATRIAWWMPEGTSYADAALFSRAQAEEIARSAPLPADPLPHAALVRDDDPRPLFIGHYWREGEEAELLAHNVACVDYSACRGGSLVAYRWSGEDALSPGNFVSVR